MGGWASKAVVLEAVTARTAYNQLQDTTSLTLLVDASPASWADDRIDSALRWDGSAAALVDAALGAVRGPVEFDLLLCTAGGPGSEPERSLLAEFRGWTKARPRAGGSTGRMRSARTVQGGLEAFRREFPWACLSGGATESRLFPSCLRERVYISSWALASDRAVIEPMKVTHIVNCTPEHPNPFEPDVEYLRVPVVDQPDQDLLCHLPGAVLFIKNAIADPSSTVLVHCRHGQSRSASVLAAWLCASEGCSVEEAAEQLSRCRPRARPKFLEQVNQFVLAEQRDALS